MQVQTGLLNRSWGVGTSLLSAAVLELFLVATVHAWAAVHEVTSSRVILVLGLLGSPYALTCGLFLSGFAWFHRSALNAAEIRRLVRVPANGFLGMAIVAGTAIALVQAVVIWAFMEEYWHRLPSIEFGDDAWAVVLGRFLILGAVWSPTEELVWRGMMLPAMMNRFGRRAGLVVHPLLFWLAHGTSADSVGPLLLGVTATVVYDRTRSLALTSCIHASYNASWALLAYGLGLVFVTDGQSPP